MFTSVCKKNIINVWWSALGTIILGVAICRPPPLFTYVWSIHQKEWENASYGQSGKKRITMFASL